MAKVQVPILSHYEWQKSIKQILATPPGSPAKGDRYIVGPSPSGNWVGHENEIVTYNTSWEFTSHFEGMTVYDVSQDILLQFTTIWEGLLISGRSKVHSENAGKTLSIADGGRTFTAANAGSVTFFLPSVNSGHIGTIFRFVKLGSGTLTIEAADSDIIADSGPGDTIYNNEVTQSYATLCVLLASATQWVIIEGHGTWTTTTS